MSSDLAALAWTKLDLDGGIRAYLLFNIAMLA